MRRSGAYFVGLLVVAALCGCDGTPVVPNNDDTLNPVVSDGASGDGAAESRKEFGIMNLTMSAGPFAFTSAAIALFGEDVEDCDEDLTEVLAEIGVCTVTETITSPLPNQEEDDCADRLLEAGAVAELTDGSSVIEMPRDGGGKYHSLGMGNGGLDLMAGETITFSFPGGQDIAPFEASVVMPHEIELLAPEADAALDFGAGLHLEWQHEEPADGVKVILVGSEPTSGLGLRLVTVVCDFPDNCAATIPAEALTYLPTGPFPASLSVSPFNMQRVNIPLRSGGTAPGSISAQWLVQRMLSEDGGQLRVRLAQLDNDLFRRMPFAFHEQPPCLRCRQ